MIDSSLSSETGPDETGEGSDQMDGNVELPVSIDTVKIDGTAPGVGDKVDLRVSGTVTRVVNDMAYVKPESINDLPMKPALKPNSGVSEMDRLEQMSKNADSGMGSGSM